MPGYKVEFDPGLIDRLRNGGERAQGIMRAGLSDIGREFVDRAGSIAGPGPYGDSFSSTPDGDTVTAGSKSPMAALIERGRRPGRRPPPQSIVKRKGGSMAAAGKAADRIAASGTKGRHVVKKANSLLRFDGTIERVARQVVKAVADGG